MKRSVTAGRGGRRVRRTLPEGVIRRLRLERELSQLQPALKARVDLGTVSRLERGLHYPYPHTFSEICKVLGVTVEEVLGRGTRPW